ncbi:CDP-alcohol phosphatidyltransferase family protein [Chloroflexota bacterium]
MGNQTVISQKRLSSPKLSEFRKTAGYHLTRLLVRLIARTYITPNIITWSGFILTLGAVALILAEHLFAAGFVVLVAAFFDMLDGALARTTDRVTRFGSVLDSTLDRLSEAVLLLSILVTFAWEQSTVGIIFTGLALLGSPLVSYIRSRAEAAGIECMVGIFTRPERVVVLVLGLLLSGIDYALIIALGIIAVFSFITAGQRLFYVWRKLK